MQHDKSYDDIPLFVWGNIRRLFWAARGAEQVAMLSRIIGLKRVHIATKLKWGVG